MKKQIRENTIKIKYWFSDGSTKTWKLKKGEITKTWNTYKGEKNVRRKS